MTRENALAGHVVADAGMSSSSTTVGIRSKKPDTKYSVRTRAIVIVKTKPTSFQSDASFSGRWRPRRSIRASSASSTGIDGPSPMDLMVCSDALYSMCSPADDSKVARLLGSILTYENERLTKHHGNVQYRQEKDSVYISYRMI